MKVASLLALALFTLSPSSLAFDATVTFVGRANVLNGPPVGPLSVASSNDPISISFRVQTPANNLVSCERHTIVASSLQITIGGNSIPADFDVTNTGATMDFWIEGLGGFVVGYSNSGGCNVNSSSWLTNGLYLSCDISAQVFPVGIPDLETLDGSYDMSMVNALSYFVQLSPQSGTGFSGSIRVFLDSIEVQVACNSPETYCGGNGGDQLGCSDCPCGNNAPAGSSGGCQNSVGQSTTLTGLGVPRVSSDSLRFELENAAPSTFAILFSGTNRAPANASNPCFGLDSGITSPSLDGLRCAVQDVQRHGTRPTDSNGDSGLTTPGWGPPNGPPGGILATYGFTAGQTRHFQIIYREDVMSGCGTGQNTSNGVSVTFCP